ncbi:MAG: radical SAM protein [Oscillospiraceae bacterium]|nr:radical SAM protein [Oscillospiraceae bacterium]
MDKNYIYHAFTKTLCSKCGGRIDGKIAYDDKSAYIFKLCPDCGEHREILEENAGYHLQKYKYDKPGTQSSVQTNYGKGCPYDCGLCENHGQHTCIGLIEITGKCNLECPMCYAKNGGGELALGAIEKMMDFYMEAEGGGAELLQISGGEPTLHKDVLPIIEMAKNKGFKYVMLNTNGIKIAEDEEFVCELAKFRGGFEVYLQFDGLDDKAYSKLRGKNLAGAKKQAIANLNKYKIPATLVATIEKGVNDHLCGEILVYGMNAACVRGVNYQPVGYYGDAAAPEDRITLSGILDRIEKQTGKMMKTSDFIPLPCDVERVAITYLFKDKKGFIPITRNKDLSEFKNFIGNTFVFTVEDALKNFGEDGKIFDVGGCCDLTSEIKKRIPKNFIFKSKEEKLKFVDENTFRISVSSFVDRYNFDMKSMQKECVHIITPDLRRIPFSAYNMIYRRGANGIFV